MNYNEIIQKAGRKIRKDIYYYDENNNKIEVERNNIKRVKYGFHSSITGTVMRELEAELTIPLDTPVYLKITASFEEYSDSIEFGPLFLKTKAEYDANSKTYFHNYYDYMIQTMKDYKAVDIQYPCTLFQFFEQLLTELNLTTNIIALPNGDRTLEHDVYTDIYFTYRDVLDDIAKANGLLLYIDVDEVKIAEFKKDNTAIIDDNILKNVNVEFGKHYGPINSIVLSRSAETDNVFLQDEESIKNYGLTELKIVDNQLMNDNNRSEYLPALLAQLNNIEFDIFDTNLTGFGNFEILQNVNFQTGNNTYSSYVFNNEVEIDNGYTESIFTEEPTETTTDYKVADKTDKKIDQAYIVLNKQTKEIQLLVKKDDVINQINLSKDAIVLSGNRLIVEADNLQIQEDGTVIASNIDITGGTIDLSTELGQVRIGKGVSGLISLEAEQGGIAYDAMYNVGGMHYKKGGSYRFRIASASDTPYLNLYNGSGAETVSVRTYDSAGLIRVYDGYGNFPIALSGTSGNVKCTTLTQTSLAEHKKNIELYLDSALEEIKKVDIYKYNFKNEKDQDKKHLGFIIGEDYNYSTEITALDEKGKETGVDSYSMTSLCLKAIKEQQEIIENLESRIKELEGDKR
jgi:hypothetical protein